LLRYQQLRTSSVTFVNYNQNEVSERTARWRSTRTVRSNSAVLW